MSAAPSITVVRERGIIFSSPMVRLLLADQKSQTRRVVKLPRAPNHLGRWEPTTVGGAGVFDSKRRPVPEHCAIWHTRTGAVVGSPHRVGDRLWVRETFRLGDGMNEQSDPTKPTYAADWPDAAVKWKSPLFMPRALSRITLEITDVRVELLQAISEDDATAEGVRRSQVPTFFDGPGSSIVYEIEGEQFASARTAYSYAWAAIHGKNASTSWEANPFVWAYSFRRLP
jgi:hypothetical protein